MKKYFFQFIKKEDGTRSESMCGTTEDIARCVNAVDLPKDEFFVLILSEISQGSDDSADELFSRFPLMYGKSFINYNEARKEV